MTGHLLILASAGTGKTFELTGRLLALLLRGEEPGRILATTFTRAAAAEILARTLRRLADGGGSDRAAARLGTEIGLSGVRPAACREGLRKLLSAGARLNIGTLDSLCARLAGASNLDLDLAPAWRLVEEDEEAALRLDTVREVVGRHGPDLFGLLVLLRAGRGTSNVIASIAREAERGLQVWTEAPDESWRVPPPPYEPLQGHGLDAAIASVRGLTPPPTASGSPNANWAKALRRSIELATAGEWDLFLEGGLPSAIASRQESYHRIPIPAVFEGAFRPLIAHASAAVLHRFNSRTGAIKGILELFGREFRALQRRRGTYRFDDLTRALADFGASDPILYERLDASIGHILLDEFQDTSVDQFRLLEPMFGEIVAGGEGTFFCVGDAKQSLYSWRRAEPGLLTSISGRWPHLHTEERHRNWRSSQVILDAANDVFGSLASNGVLDKLPLRAAAEAFGATFRPHEAARDLPGLAALHVAPEGGCPTLAVELAATIQAQAPAGSLALLVRTRKLIARLIHDLRKAGLEASEEGGNPLTDSPAVAAALSALHLADHPGDSAAAFHIASSPLARILGLSDRRDERAIDALALGLRREIADRGLGPTVFDWLARLSSDLDARDFRRFEQLAEAAESFDGVQPTAEFIRRVRIARVEDPDATCIRVMTIHASKGLEFDAVILPELGGRLAGQTMPTLIARRPAPLEPIDAVTAYPGELVRRLDPELQSIHDWHTQRTVQESLCILYVAMTRAKRRLDMIVDAGAHRGTFAELLTRALVRDDASAVGEAAVVWRLARGEWWEGINAAPRPRAEAFPVSLGVGHSRRPAEVPSAGHARRLSIGDAGREGEVLHAWFERIGWLEDGEPERDCLLSILRRVAPELSRSFSELAAVFARALAAAPIRDLLSRPRAGGPWTLHREVDLVRRAPDREGEPAIGRLDRLVLGPGRAHIIDFKSDADPAGIVERHTPQMRAYADAVEETFVVPRSVIRASLIVIRAGTIAEIPVR